MVNGRLPGRCSAVDQVIRTKILRRFSHDQSLRPAMLLHLTYALRRVFLFALPAMVRSAPFAIQILCAAKGRRYVPRPT
jgi:hypothetical protein